MNLFWQFLPVFEILFWYFNYHNSDNNAVSTSRTVKFDVTSFPSIVWQDQVNNCSAREQKNNEPVLKTYSAAISAKSLTNSESFLVFRCRHLRLLLFCWRSCSRWIPSYGRSCLLWPFGSSGFRCRYGLARKSIGKGTWNSCVPNNVAEILNSNFFSWIRSLATLSIGCFTIFCSCGLWMYWKYRSIARWRLLSPYVFAVAWIAFAAGIIRFVRIASNAFVKVFHMLNWMVAGYLIRKKN